ncbi:MAG TPA: amidohydrolase family protein, partial [Thermoanaerobaculia bacterium]|nr:amidohydrolase family protein [Thermoanaerobaculia bacterium]
AGSFWSWREAMYELVGTLDPERFRALCLQAFREMRSAGITTVGEFHYLHHAADVADYGLDEVLLEAAAEAGIRLALLQAYYRWGAPGRPLEGPQRRFRSDSVAGFLAQLDRLAERLDPRLQSLGIAAHSLRAAAPDEVAELWAESERRDLPFHMHVEEQVREIAECAAAYGKRPMELLLDRLPLSKRFTAVHCTHTDRRDLERFAAAGATACLCPTTEASLGDGVPDLPALLAAGGRVCLGTDSNARISMLEEARWLELSQRLARERRGIARDAAGRVATTLLHAATRHGARALGVAAGELRPGAWADVVAIDLAHPELEGWTEDTLLESIFLGAGDRVIAATCVGGRWLAAGTG